MKIFRFDGALHLASFDYFLSRLYAQTGLNPRRLAAEARRSARSRAVLVRVTPAHNRLLSPFPTGSTSFRSSFSTTSSVVAREGRRETGREVPFGIENPSASNHYTVNSVGAALRINSGNESGVYRQMSVDSNRKTSSPQMTTNELEEKATGNFRPQQNTEMASPQSSITINIPAKSMTDRSTSALTNMKSPQTPRLPADTSAAVALYATETGHPTTSLLPRSFPTQRRDSNRIHHLIFDCSCWSYIDATALEQLADV